ncbi:MAG: hypothetical protein WCK77_25755 [Verrucomicrobiota bacterium]
MHRQLRDGWFWGSVAALALCVFGPLSSRAAEGGFPPLLFAAEGAGKIIQYDRDGKVAWEYPAEMSRDVWRLPNGNVLFCFNRAYDSQRHDGASGVMEVSRDKKVVWQFSTTGQVWSCQRLADGNTLVGAASQGKLLIVNPAGQVAREIKLRSPGGHSCLRNARQLPNGNFLVAEEGAGMAREYGADGKLAREIKVDFAPYSALRLDNGNTLICGQQSMVEVDAAGTIVWSLQGAEIPEMGIRWFAGIQVLPGGNIFVCNAGGKVPFLEVSRAKKIVWQSPPGEPPFPLGHGVQRLDVAGRACK